MKIVIDKARSVSDGIWTAEATPHEVRLLGPSKTTVGARSILLLREGLFDEARGRLEFDTSSATVINVGTGNTLVAIAAEAGGKSRNDNTRTRNAATMDVAQYAPGDAEFIRMVERYLQNDARDAALHLLAEIRKRWPGNLKRGKKTNFSETPDNFWYVIIQPRNQSLSITVRGLASLFSDSPLQPKVDRPGYARFKVSNVADVPEAISIISRSRRKSS